jgi:hypothetical protein
MKNDRWIDFVARVNAKLEYFSFTLKFKVQYLRGRFTGWERISQGTAKKKKKNEVRQTFQSQRKLQVNCTIQGAVLTGIS